MYLATSQVDAYIQELLKHPITAEICNDSWASDLYFKPFVRMAAYYLGFLAGFLIYESRKRSKTGKLLIELKKIWQIFIYIFSWLMVPAMIISICLLPKDYWFKQNWSRLTMTLYSGLFREWWSISIILMLILTEKVTVKSSLNFPSWFIKHKMFLLCSRLNYSSYCIHFVVCRWLTAPNPAPKFYTATDVLSLTIATIILSYAMGFWLYAWFEAPFARLVNKYVRPRVSIIKLFKINKE